MARGTATGRVRGLLRGPGRGSEETEQAAAAPATTFALDNCEIVDAGAEALLRVSGRWRPDTPEKVELLVSRPGAIAAVAPLPPGPSIGENGLWSAAFAVDSSAARAKLLLWAGAGRGVGLPAPRARHDDRPAPDDLAAALEEAVDAVAKYEQSRERADRLEAELATAREGLGAAERTIMELGTREQALRQELDSLRRTDLGPDRRPSRRRGRRVPAHVYDEAVARADAEAAERECFEAEAAKLSERIRELEQELASTPAAATVEADLRHLLARRERELEAARTELNEQRARFTSVASQVPARQPQDGLAEQPSAWTVADQDLLDRIARAKQLAGDA